MKYSQRSVDDMDSTITDLMTPHELIYYINQEKQKRQQKNDLNDRTTKNYQIIVDLKSSSS